MSDMRLIALSRMMAAAIENSNTIYHPSLFWENLNRIHEENIIDHGFDNFKIDANLHYFNFIPPDFEDPNIRAQISLWPSHFDNSVIETVLEGQDMFPTPYLAELYRIYVSLLWGFTNHNDSLGSFEQMSEPLIGNPIRVKRKNTYISQDLCHSYRDYHTIVTRGYDDRSSNGRVIGELGSGYGRVGYVFGMLSDARYCFFDIPPALAIAQTYFEAVFPDRKIFGFRDFSDFAVVEAEIGASQFAFFTANQIALFPDSYFDTFINISSLHEMRHDQISHYLKEFDRLTRRSIYLKQWTSWENTRDNIVVTSNDYPLPEHWEPVIDQQDAALPLFFERLLRRR